MSAGQQVFNILDLVEEICESTSQRTDDGEFLQKQGLRSLILVNRVARHAAQRRLWRHVSGLSKLYALLPPATKPTISQTLLQWMPINGGDNLQRYQERFLFFTNMIHSYTIYDYSDRFSGWDRLRQYVKDLPTGTHAFPNLKYFSLPRFLGANPQREWTEAMDVFSGGRTIQLCLSVNLSDFYWSRSPADSLRTINTHFPMLASFDISKQLMHVNAWTSVVFAALRTIPALRIFSLHVDIPMIDHLAEGVRGLHNLRLLKVSIARGSMSDPPSPSADPRPTKPSSMKQLDLLLTGGNGRHQVEKLLESFRWHCVAIVNFILSMDAEYGDGFVHSTDPNTAHQEILGELSLHSHLKAVSYSHLNLSMPGATTTSIPTSAWHEFGHTFEHCALTEFDFRISDLIIVEQELLDRIVDCCPQLQKCVFSPGSHPGGEGLDQSLPTLQQVVTFASKLQSLSVLGIAMNCHKAADLPFEARICPSLTVLDVGSSSLDDAEYIVDAFRSVYPHLDNLSWTSDTSSPMAAAGVSWEVVNERLFGLKRVKVEAVFRPPPTLTRQLPEPPLDLSRQDSGAWSRWE